MKFHEDRVIPLAFGQGPERDIHVWEPAEPRMVAVAIHGGMSHAGDYCTPALWLKQRGVAMVSRDLPGHCGEPCVFIRSFDEFLVDTEHVIRWANEEYPDLPLFVVGHSMGGLIAASLALSGLSQRLPVEGLVLSSPFFGSTLRVAPVVAALSRLLTLLVPKMRVPLEDFSGYITHDRRLLSRISKDRLNFTRARYASVRFATEIQRQQRWVAKNISKWSDPVLALIAGDDRLSDVETCNERLDSMPAQKLTRKLYPDNYHENFNELNREEIFQVMLDWLEATAR